MSNVVTRELDIMLDIIQSKLASDDNAVVECRSIDCDVSNIIHYLSTRHSGIYSTSLVKDTAIFLKNLAADSGYTIVPILDGDKRPQSKRDAFKRRYDASMDSINSFYCRQAAMKLAATPESEMTNKVKEELAELNKEAKRLDRAQRLCIPVSFKDDLVDALHEVGAFVPDRRSGGKVSQRVIKAEFEADYIIAYRMRNRMSTLLYSSDADMTALCGPNVLSIRFFGKEKGRRKGKRKNDDCEDDHVNIYEVTGSSNALMNEIKTKIERDLPGSRINYSEAKYPLLEEPIPPLLTALYCVGCGCDVLPGGVKGVTPNFLTQQLNQIKRTEQADGVVSPTRFTSRFEKLVKIYIEKDTKYTRQDILTYCQAFLYQPALEMGLKDDPLSWHYVFEKPSNLHPYLGMFAYRSDSIINIDSEDCVNIAQMKQCKGIAGINSPHKFLSCEGSYVCSCCGEIFCSTCGYSPEKDRDGKRTKKSLVYFEGKDNAVCFDCYKENILLPYSNDIANVLSLDQMREYLREKNQMLGNTDIEPHEIQELYELTLVVERRHSSITEDVPYPLYASESLTLNENKYGFGELVERIEMKEGGRFLNSPKITDCMIPDIIKLFADIVRFDRIEENEKEYAYNSRLLKVLPSMVVNFACNARVGSGYRLLKRCLRHALDPRAFALDNTTAHLFKREENGEIGLVLCNKVAASMKDVEYTSTIAFTGKDVLCTKCECHAGGHDKERVLCVHNLPLVYQLVMLLDDGLAEHLLTELCSLWHAGMELDHREKHDEMKNNISILMQCAGESIQNIKEANSKLTIKAMLDFIYATGTERKKRRPAAPSIRELRPIRNVDFSSLSTKAKKRKVISNTDDAPVTTDNVADEQYDQNDSYRVDYYEVYTSIIALGFDIHTCDFPGMRVLCMRVEEILKSKSEKMVNDYINLKRKRYNEIIELTYFRKRPFRQTQIRQTATSNVQQTTTTAAPSTTNISQQRPNPSTESTNTTTVAPSTTNISQTATSNVQQTTTTVAPSTTNISQQRPNPSTESTNTTTVAPSTTNISQQRPNPSTVRLPPPVAVDICGNTEKRIHTKRGPRYKCCFAKCEHTERTSRMRMVKNLPSKKPNFATEPRLRDVRRYVQAMLQRKYFLKVCSKKDEGRNYFYCTHHSMTEVKKSFTVTREFDNGKRKKDITIDHKFLIPDGTGIKAAAPSTRKSKGVGYERAYNRHINNMTDDIAYLDPTINVQKQNLIIDAAVTNAALVLQSFSQIDKLVEENMQLRKENAEMKRAIELERNILRNGNHIVDCGKKSIANIPPVINFHEMAYSDFEVKRRTGFQSLAHMMTYIIIICNGDFEKVIYKETSLTWLEEWFLFFEIIWGRSLIRWIDATATYKTSVHECKRIAIHIFLKKLTKAKACRSSWPPYVSFKEDQALTKQKWRNKFEGKRVVMWDDTNVNLQFMPSGADEQRLTYSPYYGGNCAKGGVFLQLCGWIGVESLWVGATSDSYYQQQTDIFGKQEKFAAEDLVDGEIIPFLNILDKGYRVNLPAWRAGRQLVMQPTFKQSDLKFTGRQTVHTADIATTRSGNERGVNRSKLSGYIKRGIHQAQNPSHMDDVWLTWSFQTNFMYKTVL